MEFGYLLAATLVIVAALYSSVGHGGASGYLAMMALFGVAATTARPSALILNLVVSSIAAFQYLSRGYFNARIFLWFAVASIPLAYLGGSVHLPGMLYRQILGLALLVAAARLAIRIPDGEDFNAPSIPFSLLVGGIIGFVSGLVGVGGGIFLTPVLLLMKWTDAKTAAGISALFIFVNSAAALFALRSSLPSFSPDVYLWLAAAIFGGFVGSSLGAGWLRSITLRRLLAAVLVIAAVKLFIV